MGKHLREGDIIVEEEDNSLPFFLLGIGLGWRLPGQPWRLNRGENLPDC